MPASIPVVEEITATVVAARGVVEVQRREKWTPIVVGERLRVTDSIRTSDDGEVDLAVNDVKLRIHERSEFAVKKLSDRVIRGRLTGRLESEVAEGKGEVEVEAAGSDAVVRTAGGHFSMIANGRGIVAVANITGQVSVKANGKALELAAGQITHVVGSAAPEAPDRALRNVLLSVAWPTDKITNRSTISLGGKVEVGTRLVVAGKTVEADSHGMFKAEVELKQGKQLVAVSAIDVLGRKKHMRMEVVRDSRKPHVRMKDKLWR